MHYACAQKSSHRKTKSVVKPPKSDARQTDAIAACRLAEKIANDTAILKSVAMQTIDSHGYRDNKLEPQRLADVAKVLLENLRQLNQLLWLPHVEEALEIANDYREIQVERRAYPSYCFAALIIGQWHYRVLLKFACGIAAYEASFLGEPEAFQSAIDAAAIKEHWTEICREIVNGRVSFDEIRNLGLKTFCERKRVEKKREDDSVFLPATMLMKVGEFKTYKEFKKFLKMHSVRTKNPRKNRLLVHPVDYFHAVAKRDERAFAQMGNAGEMTPEIIQGIEDRERKVRDQKQRRV